MGYRKVYLTIEEEEDIARIKAMRTNDGRGGAAYNAILKEGLAMVLTRELELRRKAVLPMDQEGQEAPQSEVVPVRRRRKRAPA
jgi:molybdenum-dependent DNA-binding transcriptional regulator ModE